MPYGIHVFTVTENNGAVHTIECHYFFNNDGELVFRTGERGNTEIVAIFAAGQWSSCVKVRNNG